MRLCEGMGCAASQESSVEAKEEQNHSAQDLPDKRIHIQENSLQNGININHKTNGVNSVSLINPKLESNTTAVAIMANQKEETPSSKSQISSDPKETSLLPELTRTTKGHLVPQTPPDANAPDGFLSVQEMYNMFNSGYGMPYIHHPHYLLMLDVRPESDHKACHIATARHHTAIDNVYDCLLHSGKLDQYSFIVLYDENSKVNHIGETLNGVYERIKERHSPYILDGGFAEFKKAYPFLCTDSVILTEKERYQELQTYPSSVLDGVLYQGNGKQATTRKVIEDLRITHIVNITVEYENVLPDLVDYLRLQFRDELESNMEHRLSMAADYIAEAIRGGGRVLVHCVMGISRSSTITLSFLMKYFAWTLEDAFNFLKDNRPAAQPNRSFFLQLGNFEREVFGKHMTDAEQLWIG